MIITDSYTLMLGWIKILSRLIHQRYLLLDSNRATRFLGFLGNKVSKNEAFHIFLFSEKLQMTTALTHRMVILSLESCQQGLKTIQEIASVRKYKLSTVISTQKHQFSPLPTDSGVPFENPGDQNIEQSRVPENQSKILGVDTLKRITRWFLFTHVAPLPPQHSSGQETRSL